MQITDTAAKLGIHPDQLIPYGMDVAKVSLDTLAAPRQRRGSGRLVLVTAITPTPAGEGKTTTTIGLCQAMERAGASVCAALREPSMGPCFGIKGGGTGGGKSQLIPADRINMHFTGDLHAVTSAHNLLAALIDNHLSFRKTPRLDPNRILWKRVMDMNDRSLRSVTIGLGGRGQGTPRESGFDITAASEVMAILCLATDLDDLRHRLSRILIGFDESGAAVFAGDLGAAGAMTAVLKDALQPNLVQTTEGTPAFVHGGPFANIAHGCNSVLATQMALHHADWAVTEAGFGLDLGAEKFFNIKCRGAGLAPSALVLVATVRALKLHGGAALGDLSEPSVDAVTEGLPNLIHHLETARSFKVPVVVAINRFPTDTDAEVSAILQYCQSVGVPAAESTHYADGGAGAARLAELVMAQATENTQTLYPTYRWEQPVREKISTIAKKIYGAKGVEFSALAQQQMRLIQRLGCDGIPVCMAKTHRSISDDPRQLGRPGSFTLTVRSFEINRGAGMLVALTGDMVRMPGMPREPAALGFDVIDGYLIGASW